MRGAFPIRGMNDSLKPNYSGIPFTVTSIDKDERPFVFAPSIHETHLDPACVFSQEYSPALWLTVSCL